MTTLKDLRSKLKTLINEWVYLKSETDNLLSQKISSNDSIFNDIEYTRNKATVWDNNTVNSDWKYPSAKLVKDSLDTKADTNHTHSIYTDEGVIDELGTLLDDMIATEPITFRIDFSSSSELPDVVEIRGIEDTVTINRIGSYAIFKLKVEDIENAILYCARVFVWNRYYLLDGLIDSDEDGVITASISDLTETTL